jgi:hypothetical protein
MEALRCGAVTGGTFPFRGIPGHVVTACGKAGTGMLLAFPKLSV